MKFKKEGYRTGEKALTPKEYDKLMSVVDRLDDEVIFKLAICTGARREDLASIKVSDIDLEELTVSFYEQKKNRIHTVTISSEMARLIKQLLNSRGKQQSDYIYPWTGRTAYDRLQKYCDKAGIPRRPIHALRATCVKRCQAAGWSIEQVARLTGDTIGVIQHHYSWPSRSEMKEIANEKPLI